MPQGARTPAEKVQFGWMLDNVNLLYLGASVLILNDLSYQSRVCARARGRTPTTRPPRRRGRSL